MSAMNKTPIIPAIEEVMAFLFHKRRRRKRTCKKEEKTKGKKRKPDPRDPLASPHVCAYFWFSGGSIAIRLNDVSDISLTLKAQELSPSWRLLSLCFSALCCALKVSFYFFGSCVNLQQQGMRASSNRDHRHSVPMGSSLFRV